MSRWGIVLLLLLIVGTASVLVLLPDVVTTLFQGLGLGLSDLGQAIQSWFTVLPQSFRSALAWISTPMLYLLALFGLSVSRGVAVVLTFTSIAVLAILVVLFLRSTFTKIGFRNIPRRKLRNALTVLAIVLGVALFVGVNIAFDSVYAQFQGTVTQATGSVDITVRSVQDTPFLDTLLSTVRATADVADASARLGSTAVISPNGSEWDVISLIGLDSRSDFDYRESVNITRKLPFISPHIELDVNGTKAVVDERLDYAIGDLVLVYVLPDEDDQTSLNDQDTPDLSRLARFTVVGIHHPPAGSGGPSIYIDLVTAQRLCDCPGEIRSINVKVSEFELTEKVVSDLRTQLGTAYIVTPVKTNVLNTMEEATSGLQYGLQVMSALSLCVAIVIVLNTMYMNVGERTREVGILRSTGASTRQVFWVFFSETLTLGLTGAALGLVAGILMTSLFLYVASRIFQPFMSDFLALSLSTVRGRHLALGAGAGLVTALVGGIFPSLSACRIPVIKAIRPTMRKPGKTRTALKLMAIGLPLTLLGLYVYMRGIIEEIEMGIILASLLAPVTAVGIIFTTAGTLRGARALIEHALFLYGHTRKIISRNIDRNLIRSTACFALIGISLCFVVVMGAAQTGITMGVEDVIRSFAISDIVATSQANISRFFAADLTSLDDASLIHTATPAIVIPQQTFLENEGLSMKASTMVISIDPTTYPEVMSMQFSEATPIDVFEQLNSAGIILSTPLALSLNTTVGDLVRLSTTENVTAIDFTVVGVTEGAFLQMMSFGGASLAETCYISYASLNQFFPAYQDDANIFFMKAQADQDVDHIKTRILESYSEYELQVITYNDISGQVGTGIDQIFSIFNGIVMFAVVNAIIGVTSVMIMNVATRRREIGILRSQGVSNTQIVTLVMGESVTLGLVGFGVGTVLGLIFHRITVSYMSMIGFVIPFFIPYDAIGLALLLAMFTSLLSAIYPAYRAYKLNIIESLRY